jgi:hypothetical protein
MDRKRAAKLIRMLSSDHDGEALAAARKLAALGIHDVAALVDDSQRTTTTMATEWTWNLKHGVKRCVVCWELFKPARRSDAQTCSTRCRVRKHRGSRNWFWRRHFGNPR